MSGSRFLVTGGSQGIGAAVVELAAKAGHQVVFTGRNDQFIEAVAKKTGARGVKADVSVPEDNARTVAACDKHMGGVDVLINNAGAVNIDAFSLTITGNGGTSTNTGTIRVGTSTTLSLQVGAITNAGTTLCGLTAL